IFFRSRPLRRFGVRVPTEFSQRTRLFFPRSRMMWLLLVGFSSQSFAKQMISWSDMPWEQGSADNCTMGSSLIALANLPGDALGASLQYAMEHRFNLA